MAEQNVAVEVVVSWDGVPLDSTVASSALCVGPSAGAWFMVPPELLASDHVLVEPSDAGFVLRVPMCAELTLARGGRSVSSDEAAIVGGVRRIAMEAGLTAEVRLGRLTFFVRSSERVADVTPRLAFDGRWVRWVGAAAVLHGIFLVLFAMSPPAAGALNLDRESVQTRYLNIRLDGAAREVEPPVTTPSAGDAGGPSSSAGGVGGGEADRAQQSSSPGPRRTDGRRQPQRTPSTVDPRTIGTIAAIQRETMSFGDGSSPYTAGSGQDGEGGLALNAAALLMPRGPSWGALDLGGTGVGTCDPRQRRCTDDAVDVGGLETRDPGDRGPGPGLRDRRPPRAPDGLRPGEAETLGSLSREQVRRVVRRHMSEVRFCYEQGLLRRPDIEGRVAVQFIVGPSGVVETASMTSTVNDNQVGSCVASAVRRWTFPEAQGQTGVSYPFVMQPVN